MDWRDKKPIKQNNVVFREVNGENLLVPNANFNSHRLILFALNEAGRIIWDMIDGNATGKEIVLAIMRKYEVKESIAKRDVWGFLSLLKKERLIS